MEDTNFGTDQGNPGKGGTSNPSGKPSGKDGQGDRGNRQPDKPGARPTPSGMPNEGRRMEGEGGSQKPGQSGDQQGSREESASSPGQTQRQGQEGYEYKGGRQGQSGVPNPDDVDDAESAGSFRGTAELNSESDAEQDTESDEELETETDEDDDDVEQSIGADQKRSEDLNSPLRNPK